MTPFRLAIWRGVNRILHKKIIALYADDGRNPAKIISTGQCAEAVSRNVFEEADNGFGRQSQMRIVRYGGYGQFSRFIAESFSGPRRRWAALAGARVGCLHVRCGIRTFCFCLVGQSLKTGAIAEVSFSQLGAGRFQADLWYTEQAEENIRRGQCAWLCMV